MQAFLLDQVFFCVCVSVCVLGYPWINDSQNIENVSTNRFLINDLFTAPGIDIPSHFLVGKHNT